MKERPAVKLTEAQWRVLESAATRPEGYLCPTYGLRGAAQTAVIRSLRAAGFATLDIGPRITDAGRAALAAHKAGAP